jgi:hypothetical protein
VTDTNSRRRKADGSASRRQKAHRCLEKLGPVRLDCVSVSMQPHLHVPANLVLQDTVERIFAQKFYADIKHGPGLYIVRGENVLLLGELVRITDS